MLGPKCDEVMHRGTVVAFDVCAKELPCLGESDGVETTLELSYVCNLFGDKVDLFVHVPVLEQFD